MGHWKAGGRGKMAKDHGVAIVTSSFLSQSLSWDCIHSCHQGPSSTVARDDSGGKETILVRSTFQSMWGEPWAPTCDSHPSLRA